MTIRACIIGFALALALALFGYFSDVYINQTMLVSNFFPISVMGFLVVLALVVNPLLRRLWPAKRLRPAEFAVIVALPFVVCVVPGLGFLRTFTTSLIMPIQYEKNTPSWQANEVLSMVPPELLANDGQDSEEAVGQFMVGGGTTGKHIGLSQIPWKAWSKPLSRWIPLFLILMMGLIGLSLVLHRQWTAHEHLVYPVAQFVSLLCGERSDAGRVGAGDSAGAQPADPAGLPVVMQRLFWFGFVPVLIFHIVNGLHAWYPQFIQIPRRIDLDPLVPLFPRLAALPDGSALFWSTTYFTVIAFAFFLPADITFSLGISKVVATFFQLGLVTFGVAAKQIHLGDGEIDGLHFGAYVGLAGAILYTGRAYYRRVFAAAVGRRIEESEVERSAVWGLRVFIVAMAAGAGMMMAMGLSWPFAILAVLFQVIIFVGLSRICAETGLFFIQAGWHASGAILGIFGATAIGPQMLIVTALICVVVSLDPREAMMPYVVNALRMAEDTGVKKGRLSLAMGATLVCGLLAGLVMVLWLQYDRGAGLDHGWDQYVPRAAFELVDSKIVDMKAYGTLDKAMSMGTFERFLAMRPNKGFVSFALTGLILFSVCSFLRMRFNKWPLHPVLFLTWMTYPVRCFAPSFFVGWLIKTAVLRFGGGKLYQRLKPLMIGLIAGELAGGLTFIIAGSIFYFVKGFRPPYYMIYP